MGEEGRETGQENKSQGFLCLLLLHLFTYACPHPCVVPGEAQPHEGPLSPQSHCLPALCSPAQGSPAPPCHVRVLLCTQDPVPQLSVCRGRGRLWSQPFTICDPGQATQIVLSPSSSSLSGEGWQYSSAVEGLPTVHKTLGSVFGVTRRPQ
jgi:hypothetical protein